MEDLSFFINMLFHSFF
ncbi:rCG38194, partial [Rattus norvegicus]